MRDQRTGPTGTNEANSVELSGIGKHTGSSRASKMSDV